MLPVGKDAFAKSVHLAVFGVIAWMENLIEAEKLDSQAVVKSAASAASLHLQGRPPSPAFRMSSRRPWAPCKSREAALAADLITA